MKDTPLHRFKYSESQQRISALFIIAGLTWLLMMMIQPSIGVSSLPIGLIVFGIFRLVMYNTKDYMKIYEHYFELKASPFSSVTLINFEDIKNVEDTEKSVTINLFSTHYPLILYKTRFKKSDIPGFIGLLKDFENPEARKAIKTKDNDFTSLENGFISCNQCSWKGSEDELHSSLSDPDTFNCCPNCSAKY